MNTEHEIEWLQHIVKFCSCSAEAYKIGYMLANEPELERKLFQRCAHRYDMLEQLLNILLAHGVESQRVRAMLENAEQRTGSDQALAAVVRDACTFDHHIARLLEGALGQASLPATVEEVLGLHYLKLMLDQPYDLLPSEGAALQPSRPRLTAAMIMAPRLDVRAAPRSSRRRSAHSTSNR